MTDTTMTDTLIQITTTFSDPEEGLKLGRALVEASLVGCAQISGPVQSLYRYNGELCEEPEFMLHLKTRSTLYPQVEKVILDQHSYQTPQITAVPITHVSPAYRQWLLTQTK